MNSLLLLLFGILLYFKISSPKKFQQLIDAIADWPAIHPKPFYHLYFRLLSESTTFPIPDVRINSIRLFLSAELESERGRGVVSSVFIH